MDPASWAWLAHEWEHGLLADIVAYGLINLSLAGMLVTVAIGWAED